MTPHRPCSTTSRHQLWSEPPPAHGLSRADYCLRACSMALACVTLTIGTGCQGQGENLNEQVRLTHAKTETRLSFNMTPTHLQAWANESGIDDQLPLLHHFTIADNGRTVMCESCSFHGRTYYFLFVDGRFSKVIPSVGAGISIETAKRVQPQALVETILHSDGLTMDAFRNGMTTLNENAKSVAQQLEPLTILHVFPKQTRADTIARQNFDALTRRYDGSAIDLGESITDIEKRLGPPRLTLPGEDGKATFIYGQDDEVGRWAIPWLVIETEHQAVTAVYTNWSSAPANAK